MKAQYAIKLCELLEVSAKDSSSSATDEVSPNSVTERFGRYKCKPTSARNKM